MFTYYKVQLDGTIMSEWYGTDMPAIICCGSLLRTTKLCVCSTKLVQRLESFTLPTELNCVHTALCCIE